jgi:hypothetical protein
VDADRTRPLFTLSANDNTHMDKDANIVQIDPNNLDKECIRLPSEYLKYCFAAVDARADLDEAKAELDVVEADILSDVRGNPHKYGLEISERTKAPTDKACAAQVAIDPRYKKAIEKVNRVKYDSEIAQAIVNAFEIKKRSIANLIDLHAMGYFSGVKMSKESKEVVDKMTERAVMRGRRSTED